MRVTNDCNWLYENSEQKNSMLMRALCFIFYKEFVTCNYILLCVFSGHRSIKIVLTQLGQRDTGRCVLQKEKRYSGSAGYY